MVRQQKKRLPYTLLKDDVFATRANMNLTYRQPPISYMDFAPDIYVASKILDIKKAQQTIEQINRLPCVTNTIVIFQHRKVSN